MPGEKSISKPPHPRPPHSLPPSPTPSSSSSSSSSSVCSRPFSSSVSYGLGFERLVCYVTATENIRDAIAYPRYPGNAEF
eukprot:768506-Hanusia_phi.AAC.1